MDTKHWCAVAAAMALAGFAGWVQAQDASGGVASGGGASVASAASTALPAKDDELAEVVITAQKREQDFQKVAISTEVVTKQQIEQSGSTQLQDAIRLVPGVMITNIAGTGSGRIFIRGIGTTSGDEYQAVIANGVALNLDGVNSNNASNLLGTMFDVERVEVLKGPQGTLYGSSALGGVVNVVTANPTTSAFETDAKMQVGNYNARTIEGMANIPLGDTLALRLTAAQNQHDGYVTGPALYQFTNVPPPLLATFGPLDMPANNFGAVNSRDYRVKMLWKPTEAFSALVSYEYTNDTGTTPGWVSPQNAISGNLVCCSLVNSPPPAWADPALFEDTYYGRTTDTWNGVFTYDFGRIGTLTFQASHNEIRDKGQQLTSEELTTTAPLTQTQNTYELRLNSAASSPVTWVTGLYASTSDRQYSLASSQFAPSPNVDPTSSAPEYGLFQVGRPYDTYNAYGQITYPVTDRFRATGGVRYSENKADYTYQLYLTDNPCSTTTSASGTCPTYDTLKYISPVYSADSSHPDTTWKLGFEYDMAANNLLYGDVATGFKSGGVQPVNDLLVLNTPDPITLEPYKNETSTAYEVGTKNRFRDNTLQLNAAVFYTIWNNMQLNTLECGIPGCSLFGSETYTEFFNATASHQYGLELDGAWLATPDDRIDYSSSFMHGTYGYTHYAWGAPGFSGYVDLQGHDMENTPAAQGNLSYSHIFRFASGPTLTAKLENEFSSSYQTTFEYYFQGHTQPGYFRNNASLTWANKHLQIIAFIRNIENKTVITSVFPFGVQAGDPRLYGSSIEVRY